jgi:hypothetical protein
MTQKKTDLAKGLAKKLGNQMKSSSVPQRYGQSATPPKAEPSTPATKLAPLTCKLPAPLIARLREQAPSHPGGLSGLMAEALTRGLG